MASSTNKILVVGATLSGLAALMHLACLVVGAPLFRLLGAGEQMAQLHLAGHWYPTVVTLVIAGALATWSAYALSGARRDSQVAVAAYCPLRNYGHLHRPGRRIRTGDGVLPRKQHDVLGSKLFDLRTDRRRAPCRPSAVLGQAVGRCGLTMRSSRNCTDTSSAWQVQLAMLPATRSNSA